MLPHSTNSNHAFPSSEEGDLTPQLTDSQYLLNNSFKEVERRKTMHTIYHYILGKKFMAPMEEGLNQGITDIAESYPKSIIVGIQLDGYKIRDDIPNNLSIAKCNVDNPLPFPISTFDFVFIRCACCGVLKTTWPNFLLELKRVLKPGGYLEWFEPEHKFRGGPCSARFSEDVIRHMDDVGYNSNLAQETRYLLTAAGFGTVQHHGITIPVGPLWDEVVARAFSNKYHIAMQNMKDTMSTAWRISPEEYDQKMNAVVHEWNHVYKTHLNHTISIVRKPFDGINIDDPSIKLHSIEND
ncbi:hypothetical protein BC937DRAFT_94464 [Endogone sp. FLAS-F59071]|nr:hypothetical protein BC937DRAFT_94464 [Endogone sp. FLAS-F59071]|eukprot:RUS20751.1 hypothetical protein BC937DRAFT_94464 [Endogone sp. FLAS-F59071]